MTTRVWEVCAPVLANIEDLSIFEPEILLADGLSLGYAFEWYGREAAEKSPPWYEHTPLAVIGRFEGEIDDFAFLTDADSPQARITEKCAYVPFAMWCVNTRPFAIEEVAHRVAPDQPGGGWLGRSRINRAHSLKSPLTEDRLTRSDVLDAARVFAAVMQTPRGSTVRSAIRMVRKALEEESLDVRIVLLWIALEALFGPEDPRELSFRLVTHIGLYLGRDAQERRAIARTANDLYKVRSKVVHGATVSGISTEAMLRDCLELESLVRRIMSRVLFSGDLANFDTKEQRAGFFAELLFGARGE